MKKIVLITLTMFFELCLSKINFAYQSSTFEKFESSSSSGYSEVKNQVYLNQLMDLQNVNVKFTQDDILFKRDLSYINKFKYPVVYDYVYSIRDLEQLNVSTLYKDTWVIIKKYDEQDSKVITKEKLKDNEVGNIVCEQYMWHWDKIAFVDGKIFLVCSIEASINWIESALYNIVFEYDFENETLKYRFRYTSYTNNGIELLFGYV